jgi:hypothetical protein
LRRFEWSDDVDDAAAYIVEMTDGVSGPAKLASAAFDSINSAARNAGLAIGAAMLAVGYAMIDTSIKAHEQYENQLALADSMYDTTAAADAVVDAQYDIAASSALAQDKVLEMGNRLEDAGVSARIYGDTLKALSDTAVIAGDRALKPIEKIIKTVEQTGKFQLSDAALKGSGIKMADVLDQLAKDTGKSVAEIKAQMKTGQIAAEDGISAMNKVLEKKFGEQAAGQLTDFSVQIQKAKDSFSNLFKDVSTEPLLNAMHGVLGLLDQSTSTGRSLKKVLTGAMNSFFKAAAATIPYVESFFLSLGIESLKTYIAIKPLIKDIGKLLGNDDQKTANGIRNAGTAGKALSFVVGSLVIGMLAIWETAIFAFQGLEKGAAAANRAWHKMTAGVKGVYSTIKGALTKAINYVKGVADDFTSAGNAMIDGLVDAIKSGASKVANAVSDMAAGAVKAAKSALGIASPSKVFHEIGQHSAQGMAGGIDAHAGKVHAAVRRLVALPKTSANDNESPRLTRGGSRNGSGDARHVTIGSGAIVIQIQTREGQDSRSIASEVRRELLAHIEELATGTGGR